MDVVFVYLGLFERVFDRSCIWKLEGHGVNVYARMVGAVVSV